MTDLIQDKFYFKNGLILSNRAVLAPMTLSVCTADGEVSQDDLNFYRRRSGGVGMVVTGSAYVHPQGQAFSNSFSVASDDKISGLSKLAQAIKSEGAQAILQIYHGGRMVPPNLIDGPPVAPSAVKALHGYVVEPRALKHQEVDEVINDFLRAIQRALRAGFDGVELHGANTYLIQQFYSPHSNRRKDKWGGSLNNRMRFAKTLVKKAQQLVKKEANRPFLIGYRLSPEEIEEPGLTLSDNLQLIEQLIRTGIDYLHLSMDNFWQSSIRDTASPLPVVEAIIKKVNGRLPLIGCGHIRTCKDAQRILEAGVPLISLGRSLLLDPNWVAKVTSGRDDEVITNYREDLKNYLQLPEEFVLSMRDYLEGDY